MYVTVSKNTGNIIYYTNGSAVIKNYKGKNIYVLDNSTIKNNIVGDYEVLSESRNLGNKVSLYEKVGIVSNNVYIAIVHKDNILFDTDGTFKDILLGNDIDNKKPITITNNTNNTIKYRLVIDKSKKTTLDVKYMKYQLLVSGKYMGPSRLIDSYWNKDNVYESLNIKGTNYVLVERILEPSETDTINVMFWIDYDTVPNSMQEKMFYGTLRLYAWQEFETAI